ncbi:MFS transporter [Nocardioides sp.]|uniref:MFS transporter n=1 Tax=Nocardioides sp. TaxID=35761 RepID=UPI0026120CD7|nr:MFS transporter [Nocardioides sp.]
MTETQPDHPIPPERAVATLQVHSRGEARDVDLTRDPPFGWWPAIVIGLVAFVDRVEINLVAGALPAIQEHFGISDTVAGAIPTAASIAAALLLLPAGRLADRAPRVGAIAIVVLVWALCSVLSGLASSFALFFLIRIAIGAAGQLYNPPASSLIADYYPSSSRGKAFGFERAGYYMGLPAGVIVGGAVAEALDWRAVFFVAAIPGLLVAALVWTVREPRRGLGDEIDALRAGRAGAAGSGVAASASVSGSAVSGSAGAEGSLSSTPPTHGPTPARGALIAEARGLLTIATLRGVIASQAMLALGVAGLFYWLPTFLERTEGLDHDAAAGLAGGVGGTGIVIGIVLGSRLGDRARADGWRIAVAAWFLLAGAIGLTLAVTLPGLGLRVTLIAAACAGFAGAIPNLTAAAADVVPSQSRGMGFAVLQFLTTLGGAFGPFLIGLTSDLLDSLPLAMLVLLPPLFACVVILRAARKTFDADVAAAHP